MPLRLVRFQVLPSILAACGILLVGPAAISAQQGGYGGGGGMHRFGNRGGGGGGGGSQSFDPVVLKGPPAPDSMSQLVGLDESGLERYKTLYENLMTSTQPERDSLAALRQARRSGGGGGGGWGADSAGGAGGGQGRRGGGMRGPASDLRNYFADRQQQFDDALTDILSKDQMKVYKDWRDQQRKEARDRMRQMRSGQSGDPES